MFSASGVWCVFNEYPSILMCNTAGAVIMLPCKVFEPWWPISGSCLDAPFAAPIYCSVCQNLFVLIAVDVTLHTLSVLSLCAYCYIFCPSTMLTTNAILACGEVMAILIYWVDAVIAVCVVISTCVSVCKCNRSSQQEVETSSFNPYTL